MLNKMRTGLNIFIMFMFVVAIVYGIVALILDALDNNNVNNDSIVSTQNIDTYIIEENLITTDYTTFFALEDCAKSFITALHENKTDDVYNILMGDVQAQIGKDKSKLVTYYNKNFKYETEADMDVIGYLNFNNLKQVYKIDNENYVCILTSINESKSAKIGIKLINNNNFLISYIEI